MALVGTRPEDPEIWNPNTTYRTWQETRHMNPINYDSVNGSCLFTDTNTHDLRSSAQTFTPPFTECKSSNTSPPTDPWTHVKKRREEPSRTMAVDSFNQAFDFMSGDLGGITHPLGGRRSNVDGAVYNTQMLLGTSLLDNPNLYNNMAWTSNSAVGEADTSLSVYRPFGLEPATAGPWNTVGPFWTSNYNPYNVALFDSFASCSKQSSGDGHPGQQIVQEKQKKQHSPATDIKTPLSVRIVTKRRKELESLVPRPSAASTPKYDDEVIEKRSHPRRGVRKRGLTNKKRMDAAKMRRTGSCWPCVIKKTKVC
jgi:hypothetical protein